MKTPTAPRSLLQTIALSTCGVATLDERKSDSLDFHEVAVWNLEAALKAAFEAGAKAAMEADRKERSKVIRADGRVVTVCIPE